MSSVKRDHTYFIEMTSELGRIIGDEMGDVATKLRYVAKEDGPVESLRDG